MNRIIELNRTELDITTNGGQPKFLLNVDFIQSIAVDDENNCSILLKDTYAPFNVNDTYQEIKNKLGVP